MSDVEHVITEGEHTEHEAGHEVASTVAETVGEAVSEAHSEGLEAFRTIIDRQEERIRALESRLDDAHSRESGHAHETEAHAAELAEAVIVAHAIEAVSETESKGEEDIAEPVANEVTEVEDDTPEVVAEEEPKSRPKRRGLYGKRG